MENPGGVKEGVPVNRSVPEELRAGKSRDQGKDPLLLRVGEFRLESDEVVHRPGFVLLAQLDDGMRNLARAGVPQSDGPQGTEGKRLRTPAGEDLGGPARFQAPLLP